MLRLLEVQNLALIDNLAFYPGSGLNVITGETGAGKSMLLGAVSLLLGERATSDALRSGEEKALMQAMFTPPQEVLLAHNLEAEEDGLSLSREIRREGPNICRINGRVQPLSAMGAVGRALVDLHGQNRQQSLLEPETQRELLDSFGGAELAAVLEEVEKQYAQLSKLKKLVASLGSDDTTLAREQDFLQFQLTEIEEAALAVEEEEELSKLFSRLTHARTLLEKTAGIYSELYEGMHDGAIVDRLGAVEKELAAAVTLDETLSDVLDNVAGATQQLTEAARELRAYHDNISLDDAQLQQVTERLEVYKKIIKKYGPTVADVLTLADKLRGELETIAGRGEKLAQAEKEKALAEQQLAKTAAKLSKLRLAAAEQLAQRINEALHSLALPAARFTVTVATAPKCGPTGSDNIEFMFAANPGEPERSLAKTASGGEISRVMLAIKSVLAEEDLVPTLIFDEIDAGIGGMTIRNVAEKLRQLARHRQVICVTHQPLIAAVADHHFTIYKEISGERTATRLRMLEASEREKELARMLGGEEGVSLEHARQLLKEE